MRTRKTIKSGDVVSVEFWDHVEGGDGNLMRCRVYGELRELHEDRIRVCGWSGLGCEDDETIWTLAMSCVINIIKQNPTGIYYPKQ